MSDQVFFFSFHQQLITFQFIWIIFRIQAPVMFQPCTFHMQLKCIVNPHDFSGSKIFSHEHLILLRFFNILAAMHIITRIFTGGNSHENGNNNNIK